LAVDLDAEGLARLKDLPAVAHVGRDAVVSAEATAAQELARMPAVQERGMVGRGVTVAVLDTGIESDHPDLVDALDAEACFCALDTAQGWSQGCWPQDAYEGSGQGSAIDLDGHGTFVSSILLAQGQVAPLGAAPEARLVAVKVLPAREEGKGRTSSVVAGLDWVLAERPDIRV